MGVLGLPADLAERLNVAAQELGLPSSEIIRAAVLLA
jgi:predicted DNA-binding protein